MQCKVKEGSGDRTHTAHFSLGSRAKRAQEVRSVSRPLANSQIHGASGCMIFACLHHEFENWQEGEEDSSTSLPIGHSSRAPNVASDVAAPCDDEPSPTTRHPQPLEDNLEPKKP